MTVRKRPSLAAVPVAGKVVRSPFGEPASSAAAPEAKPDNARPDRRGKRLVGGYFAMEVSQQIRVLAATRNVTVQTLVGEALNDLFIKYGKSPIAAAD